METEKTLPEDSEFRIEYRPLKGITRTLAREAPMIRKVEAEGFRFLSIFHLSDAKLMGFVFRRIE